jgi:spore coat protein CotH
VGFREFIMKISYIHTDAYQVTCEQWVRQLKDISKILVGSLIVLGLTACGGGSGSSGPVSPTPTTPVATPSAPAMNDFMFMASQNTQLDETLRGVITGDKIFLRTPEVIDIGNLAATFVIEGETVTINGNEQVSGVTTNDFSQPVTYTITNSAGTSKQYTVEVMQFTGLPVINLTTDNGNAITNRDDYTTGTVSVFGNGVVSDLDKMTMEIRGRGNSTWGMPKKPYQMKLSSKREFLDMENDKKWLFLAEYADKTMLRNQIAYEMGYLSDLAWTTDSEFAEVFLNEEYQGTYHITQKVEEGSDRVDLGDNGFLLEIDQFDRLDPDDVYFETGTFLINIKEPSLEENDSQYQFITRLLFEFEQALYSSSFADPNNGYAQFIDIDSFIDWYLISEITKNVDSRFFSSIYFHVIPGEKIKMGPLWDFDLAFGNVDYADPEFPEGFWIKDNPWYARLFQDPNFVNLVQARFEYYNNNRNYLLNKIDEYAEKLRYAQAENDAIWQTIGVYVWPNPVVLDTYEEEVARLKSWFNTRMDWLDIALGDL